MLPEFWGVMLSLGTILATAEWVRNCYNPNHWSCRIDRAVRRIFFEGNDQ